MARTLELHLPQNCRIQLGLVSDDKAREIQRSFDEAEAKRQSIVFAEHRGMHVSEIKNLGLSTGQIRTELRCMAIGDLELYFKSLKRAPQEGLQILAVVPASAIAKATLETLEAAA